MYLRHYKPWLVYFYLIFHCGLYWKAINITNKLCTKQRNSSIKSVIYNQERFQIVRVIMVHKRYINHHKLEKILTLSIRLHVFVVGSKRNIFGHNIFMYLWWLHIKKLEQSSWLNSTFPSGKQPTPSRAALAYPMVITIVINFAKSINR